MLRLDRVPEESWNRIAFGVKEVHVETIPVMIWEDIDVGVADLVKELNARSDMRTFSSCQGINGELPWVLGWALTEEADAWLRANYDTKPHYNQFLRITRRKAA